MPGLVKKSDTYALLTESQAKKKVLICELKLILFKKIIKNYVQNLN